MTPVIALDAMGGDRAPAAERDNWSARQALDVFKTRLGLVTRQLARSPYLAGDAFTAADISVGLARRLDMPIWAVPSVMAAMPVVEPSAAISNATRGFLDLYSSASMGTRSTPT